MEKSKLINKLRDLVYANHMFNDMIAINEAEYSILMRTFGISWDELKQPSFTFSSCYQMERTENDLTQEFESILDVLIIATAKGLHSAESETKHRLKGFLKGVRFFNRELSDNFSLIADKKLNGI
jgi:hypothetical protein